MSRLTDKPDDVSDAANTAEAGRDLSSLPDVDQGPNEKVSKGVGERLRLCIVSRQELPTDKLIRFVASPDGHIVPDLAGKLPGRGVWVTGSRTAVAEAAKRGLFSKSLKRQIKTDKNLADQVEALLLNSARQCLALANKAGLVTTGFAKVETTLERGQAVGLLAAADASADGTGKLARKFTAIRTAKGQPAPIVRELTGDDLGLALGGENVVHASLSEGGLTRRFIDSCQRLGDYRRTSGVAAGAGDPHPKGMGSDLPPRKTHSSLAEASAGTSTSNSDQAGPDHA